jgi:hypothetical protein
LKNLKSFGSAQKLLKNDSSGQKNIEQNGILAERFAEFKERIEISPERSGACLEFQSCLSPQLA